MSNPSRFASVGGESNIPGELPHTTPQDAALPKSLVIDADPGIGDALAIVAGLLDPELTVLAVTATPGCVDGRAATRNVRAVVDHVDPPMRPRIGGAEGPRPVGRPADEGTLDWSCLHGPDGLGGWPHAAAELHTPKDSPKLLRDLVREKPGEVTVLTLGPLTNLMLAAEGRPDFLAEVGPIVSLAGSVAAGGDVTAAAEFNVFADPAAAATLFSDGPHVTVVPRDVSASVVASFDQYRQIRGDAAGKVGGLLDAMVPFAMRATHEHFGVEGLPLAEVAAVAAVARPELFKTEPVAVEVETAGRVCRGATVFDRRVRRDRRADVAVATEVDAAEVLEYFRGVLAGSG